MNLRGFSCWQLIAVFTVLTRIEFLLAEPTANQPQYRFVDNLIESFEFIDYHDLLVAATEGTNPWEKYDRTQSQLKLIDIWRETKTKLSLVSPDQLPSLETLEMIQDTFRRVPHDPQRTWVRDHPITAGGDHFRETIGGYYKVSLSQKQAIEANPLLESEFKSSPDPQFYFGRHKYPSVQTYSHISKSLSPNLKTTIELALKKDPSLLTQLNDPTVKQFNQMIIKDLVEQAFGAYGTHKSTTKLYQQLISIHPFSDYNGRSLRLLYGILNKSPLFLTNWDEDLFLNESKFSKSVANGERQLNQIKKAIINEYNRPIKFHRYYEIMDLYLPFWEPITQTKQLPFSNDLAVITKEFLNDRQIRRWIRHKQILELQQALSDFYFTKIKSNPNACSLNVIQSLLGHLNSP